MKVAVLVICLLGVVAAAPSPDLGDAKNRLIDSLNSLLPNLIVESPSRCLESVKIGHCRALIPRWAFDRNTERCRSFPWGGCGGSSNLFKTEEECKKVCASLLVEESRPAGCPKQKSCSKDCTRRTNQRTGCQECVCEESDELPSGTCSLRPETGVCKGAFQRFAFDSSVGDCREFLWGGCGGNSNNFRTLTDCRSACQ